MASAYQLDNSAAAEEEEEEKAKVTAEVTKKIKTWYNNRRGPLGLHANAYTNWLTRLRGPGASPKRPADFQHYMGMAEYKQKIAEEFDRLYPDEEGANVNLRCEVAKTLYAAEPASVKEVVATANKNAHDAAVAKYTANLQGVISDDPDNQRMARDQFSSVVAPLLGALRQHTGYYITLVAACRVGNEMDVITMNEGKTKGDEGVDFTEWDKEAYKTKVLDHFVRFVLAAEETTASGSDISGGAAAGVTTSGAAVGAGAGAGRISPPVDGMETLPAMQLFAPDGGAPDGGLPEGGPPEGGTPESGPREGGAPESGAHEGGAPETSPPNTAPRRSLADMMAGEKDAIAVDEEFPGLHLHVVLRGELRALTLDARAERLRELH
ncbi:hypothetical protein DFH07DRAFT_949099 [Mycena maculata]|uniref:Uncharacterized protein n=1 Tax=Mycena maculata TaxID=230809 RepID=A0AAD7NZK4_9AGAR|nr:hypothetical protein DFH07DRAFT_949099 [Mycena maculata]